VAVGVGLAVGTVLGLAATTEDVGFGMIMGVGDTVGAVLAGSVARIGVVVGAGVGVGPAVGRVKGGLLVAQPYNRTPVATRLVTRSTAFFINASAAVLGGLQRVYHQGIHNMAIPKFGLVITQCN